jgi:hypothetical protein
MSADDIIARSVALSQAAYALMEKGHFAHAARKFGEAAAVAEQLRAPECLIVAFLRAEQVQFTLAASDARRGWQTRENICCTAPTQKCSQ